MNKSLRWIALFLSLVMLLPFAVSCQEEENTETLGPVFLSDEEAVAQYIQRIREGYYADQALYSYESLSEYFELNKYKGLTYPDDPEIAETVTEEFVNDYITYELIRNLVSDDQYTEITDGAVQKFDVVTIDYKGYVDGVFDETATAEDQSLMIGSHSYITGFEEGLIGARAGETVRLELTFSPYYGSTDVAGKPAVFEVTVEKIQRPTIPELTLETVNSLFSTSYASLDQFIKDVHSIRNEEKANYAFEAINDYLQNKILAESQIKKLPEKELKHYTDHYYDYYSQYVPEGTSMEDFCEQYLGMSYEEFEESAVFYAENAVKRDLLYVEICRREGINYTDEQLKAILEGYYRESQGIYSSMEAFIEDYVKIYGPYYFVLQLQRASVTELIYENATKEG